MKQEFIGKGDVEGFKFLQVDETSTARMYEVNTENHTHYEVFIKKYNINNEEIYPHSEDFGYTAFTYNSEEKAIEKLLSL